MEPNPTDGTGQMFREDPSNIANIFARVVH